MSTPPKKGGRPYVVHGALDASLTAQTRGMTRRPGVTADTTGASKIWMGLVTCEPNTTGPPHTHGDAETAAYVLTGRGRVYFGEGFKEYIEAGPGEFIYVPANTPHIEANPYDEPSDQVLSRSPDNIVINLAD